MAEIAATTDSAALAKAIPVALTIEIGGHRNARLSSRTRGRVRHRDTIRVAVTYRLEELGNGLLDEAELARLIRHGVRSTRRAYRLACTPAVPRNTAASVPERVPVARAREEPVSSVGSAANVSEQQETVKEVVKAEPDDPGCTAHDCADPSYADPIGADAALEKEEPAPRRLTRTQRSTLDVMAGQLDLTGAALPQLLGLRCNKKSLDDLTYREAAGLIAHFSRLLRQKLQAQKTQERQTIQGEKYVSEVS